MLRSSCLWRFHNVPHFITGDKLNLQQRLPSATWMKKDARAKIGGYALGCLDPPTCRRHLVRNHRGELWSFHFDSRLLHFRTSAKTCDLSLSDLEKMMMVEPNYGKKTQSFHPGSLFSSLARHLFPHWFQVVADHLKSPQAQDQSGQSLRWSSHRLWKIRLLPHPGSPEPWDFQVTH